MASRTGTLYIGLTNDIQTRVQQHKLGAIDGFAKKYKCTRLVYYEVYDHIYKTIAREKQLKGWRRSKKIALIEKVNPRWQDLAEKWGAAMKFAGEALS
jgi:putative endonuclease